MEFTLKGIDPISNTGETLHFDVWSWRPLWHLIINNSKDLTESDRILGQTSDHAVVSGTRHQSVIKALQQALRHRSHGEVEHALSQSPFLIVSGSKSIVEEMNSRYDNCYTFNWNEVLKLLHFCNSNKGFAIHGYRTKK